MRHCSIMIDVPTPYGNPKGTTCQVRADHCSQPQIWHRFKCEPWFVFESFHCGETPPFLWTVLLSGIWHVYGKGKGYTFDEALGRAFNQFIYRNEKFWKEQRAMAPELECCAAAVVGTSYAIFGWTDNEGNEITDCPYCKTPVPTGE